MKDWKPRIYRKDIGYSGRFAPTWKSNHPDPCHSGTVVHVCAVRQQYLDERYKDHSEMEEVVRSWSKKMRAIYSRYARTLENLERVDDLSGGRLLKGIRK